MEQSGSGELSTLQDSSKEELDTVLESISKNPSERIMSCEFDNVSQLLLQWTKDQKWADNPKLYTILHIINRTDLFPKLLDAHITDFWIPFSKLIVKRLVEEQDRKPLLDAQHRCLDEDYPPITGVLHFSYEDSEASELHEVGKLGEGGYGEVHHVQDPRTGKAYARKTMPRPGNFQRQCDLMRNFKKEVIGMRRVRHRHCVELVASFTDAGSVVLLCSPVADMDLAAYLDLDLDKGGLDILRNAVGCITSALAYLHAENIR